MGGREPFSAVYRTLCGPLSSIVVPRVVSVCMDLGVSGDLYVPAPEPHSSLHRNSVPSLAGESIRVHTEGFIPEPRATHRPESHHRHSKQGGSGDHSWGSAAL